MLLQTDLNKWGLSKQSKLMVYVLNMHQLDFYKYIRLISPNTGIKVLQIIHIYSSEPVMLHNNINAPLKLEDQRFQNGTAF